MGQEEDPLEMGTRDAPPFKTQKWLAVQRTTSRGYHFRAVYTKVSRH